MTQQLFFKGQRFPGWPWPNNCEFIVGTRERVANCKTKTVILSPSLRSSESRRGLMPVFYWDCHASQPQLSINPRLAPFLGYQH